LRGSGADDLSVRFPANADIPAVHIGPEDGTPSESGGAIRYIGPGLAERRRPSDGQRRVPPICPSVGDILSSYVRRPADLSCLSSANVDSVSSSIFRMADMTIDTSDYRVRNGERVDLAKRPTQVKPVYGSKKDYGALLRKHVEKLSDEQHLLYAADTFGLLIILQGIDSAGKDGAIRHVMSGVNPQGCDVHAFKQPSAEELQHDFLWRCHAHVPERGKIVIFNRSYYEDVLVVRVHPELLANAGLASGVGSHKKFWKERYRSIVDFERHLDENRTRVIKVFLHLSKDEQRKRFLSRIDEPEKNWKFSMADVTERQCWDDYMKAYEDCLSATSSKHAPWFVVPADDKENARLILSQIILETLEAMDLRYPETSKERLEELKTIRKELVAQK